MLRKTPHAASGGPVSICISDNPEVAVCVRNQACGAAEAGLRFDQRHSGDEIAQEECKRPITEMNDDPDVLGIIPRRPVPAHINVRSLQSAIQPLKEVEGTDPASIGNIVYSDVSRASCKAS